MIQTLFVGFGSAQGDDQVGWMAIDALQERMGLQSGALFIKCEKSPTDWLRQLPKARRVIFIDAVRSGAATGTLHRMDIRSGIVPENSFKTTSTHGISMLDSIALAQSLCDLPADVRFYGIELGHVDPMAEISPEIKAQFSELIKRIADEISIPGLHKSALQAFF